MKLQLMIVPAGVRGLFSFFCLQSGDRLKVALDPNGSVAAGVSC